MQLQSVAAGGARAKLADALTDRSGQFWFPSLPDGFYLLVSRRRGFLDFSYGEKRAGGPGKVIEVKGDSVTFAELPMRHLGAITGRLVDENQVGMADVNVYAYRAQMPLRVAANTKSDDRGNFRLSGLTPGRYWVRSGAMDLEDGGGIIPTFFPGVTESREARTFLAQADMDTGEALFMPTPGRVFTLSGHITCQVPMTSVKVTLSSDTGRKDTVVSCAPDSIYKFDELAPGRYEILAEPAGSNEPVAFWHSFALEKESVVHGQTVRLPRLEVRQRTPKRTEQEAAKIILRRVDAAGNTVSARPGGHILPGVWEVFVTPSPEYAFTRFEVPSYIARRVPVGEVGNAPRIGLENSTLVFADAVLNPGGIVEGVVKKQDAVWPGAPVYLVAQNLEQHVLIHGTMRATADAAGKFRFVSLPPGQYLLISTYDLDEITKETLADARAATVSIAEGRTETVALELYEVQ